MSTIHSELPADSCLKDDHFYFLSLDGREKRRSESGVHGYNTDSVLHTCSPSCNLSSRLFPRNQLCLPNGLLQGLPVAMDRLVLIVTNTVQPKELPFLQGYPTGWLYQKRQRQCNEIVRQKREDTVGDRRSRCSVYVGSCGFIFLSYIHPLFSFVTINGSNFESGKVMERLNVSWI